MVSPCTLSWSWTNEHRRPAGMSDCTTRYGIGKSPRVTAWGHSGLIIVWPVGLTYSANRLILTDAEFDNCSTKAACLAYTHIYREIYSLAS